MGKTATTTRKRAPKGDRSHVIDQAVRSYISGKSRTTLRELLKEGAQVRAQRDLGLVEDWFEVESEAWPGRRRVSRQLRSHAWRRDQEDPTRPHHPERHRQPFQPGHDRRGDHFADR
jgi:CopG family transcriptional regulator/antitoxin EndoAI